MSAKWIDFSGARPGAHAIKQEGAEGVLRYLSADQPATAWKRATKSEIHSYIAEGIDVILNFEWYEGRMLEGYNAGLNDGKVAMKQAKAIGYPKGATIYFSHDTSARNDKAILNYLRGASKAMKGSYEADIYSGIDTVEKAMSAGLATHGWQTAAWSNGKVGRAHIYQNLKQWFHGSADEDVIRHSPLGSWFDTQKKHPTPAKKAKSVTPVMPAAIHKILTWQHDHAGQVHYSETAGSRLDYHSDQLTKPTDCSGMVARMFRWAAGKNVGTYTGNECSYGHLLSTSKASVRAGHGLLPGDLIFFNWNGWNSAWDHVAIYAGNGHIWNHGGPGPGPNLWSLASSVDNATQVMARRFIPWVDVPKSITAPKKPVKVVDTYHVVKQGEYLGLIASHYKTTVAHLVALNKSRYPSLAENPSKISAGWKLLTVQATATVVKPPAPKPVVKPAPKPTPKPVSPTKGQPVKVKVTYHTIKSGETLFEIADHYHTTVNKLVDWNVKTHASLSKHPDEIYPGWKIRVK